MQSQSVQTCTLFHRAQEAGKALEDKINDAQSRMAVHLQQTSDASRVLEALIGESQDLRKQLQLEVRQIAEHFEDKLQSGGEAILAKDIELRSKVEVLAAGLESVGGRLTEHETDLQRRVAALEVFSDQHNQMVQSLRQAIDTNYQQLEDRVEARLNEANRHSGVQELFGQFQVASQEARDGIATIQARVDHLEASGSKGPPASADAPLAFALQALQSEVTDLSTHVARALSLSDDAVQRPGGQCDPNPCEDLRRETECAFQEVRKELGLLAPLKDLPRQLGCVKEVCGQEWRDTCALSHKVRALEASGARQRTPSDPSRGKAADSVRPPPMPASQAPALNAGGLGSLTLPPSSGEDGTKSISSMQTVPVQDAHSVGQNLPSGVQTPATSETWLAQAVSLAQSAAAGGGRNRRRRRATRSRYLLFLLPTSLKTGSSL